MEIWDRLTTLARTLPEKIKKEKESGKKAIGYTGRFIPDELIAAAGAIPYPICRGGEPEPAESILPYMLRILSPYSRAQVGYHLLGLDPVIPMLDLIVIGCSDCHTARLADLFEYFQLPTARVGVPADWKKSISFDYYRKGLIRLKERLQSVTGGEITDGKLRNAIESVNQIKKILRDIHELRRRDAPPVSGCEFIQLNHFSLLLIAEEICEELNALYKHLKEKESPLDRVMPRILLAGHVIAIGDYVLPKLIEACGGVVVCEFLDEGMRHFGWDVKTEGDLVKNITEAYYLTQIPPSIFHPAWEERVSSVKKMIEDFRVDGVIWYQISFEEVYDMESSIFSRAMEEIKIPFLKLESSYEYSREAMGPLTTRVESFIKSLK